MPGISLVDVGLKWFKDIVYAVVAWFQDGIVSGYNELTVAVFGTSTPQTGSSFVFGTPTNSPWTKLHEVLVGGEITFVSLLILLLCVQGRHTIRIFNIGSAYQTRKTKKTAWTGAFLIVTWYWVGVLTLYVVDGFTIALLPDFGVVAHTMIDFLQVTLENPALAFLMALIGGIAMWVLQALFFLREILLYVFFYGMPIGVAIAYGNLPVLSQIARRMCLKFIPLAVMPLPVAVLFKGYELLFDSGTSAVVAPESPFLSYLVATSLPVLGVLIVWKLFKYATPLVTDAIGRVAGATVTAGAILGASYLAGPSVATTAARWGPKAAATHTVAQRFSSNPTESESTSADAQSPTGTTHDNVTSDAHGQQGVPAYRRTENDPGYY